MTTLADGPRDSALDSAVAVPAVGDAMEVLPLATDMTVLLPRITDLSVPPAAPTRPTGAVDQPVRRRRPLADAALAVALTAIVMVVQVWNIAGFPGASDDEGTYLAQAWAVRHGLGLAHYTYWYDHPPVGWLQLALLAWLPAATAHGLIAVAAGRLAMLPVAAASLLLVYTLARRVGLARWAASLALLGYGLSPIAVTMMRQIYLDSFAVVWMLAALVLATSPRRHLWHHAAAGVAAALAVLSKETMLIAVPAVVVALWQTTAGTPVRSWAFGGFASGLGLTGAFYPLYAVLKGELFPGPGHVSLVGAWEFQLQQRHGSGFIFSPGSDSHALLRSWLFYDTVLLAGGLVAVALALAVRRLRAPAVAGALLALVALRPGGYLPAMYVVQVLPFFALALAGMVEVGVGTVLRGRWRLVRWVVLVALLATAAGYVVPRWYAGDRRALVSHDNAGYAAAAAYLRERIPDRVHTTVVLDDVLWLDAVGAGYPRDRVIWFYKLDLDPSVAARLTDGWRSVDYIVSTPAVRQDPASLPTVAKLLTHSHVVTVFGDGAGRIEIRQVDKESP
ncbi:MAG TPA: phospholipid carrier-dependent glycosyltransferase [Rugosimonospora sp.]|nr:phospholipid carrier-dependent glycosyltransferase [Rugosimonospora sp.]